MESRKRDMLKGKQESLLAYNYEKGLNLLSSQTYNLPALEEAC
jgi:hypothetical protein